jgi:hypothetical protein
VWASTAAEGAAAGCGLPRPAGSEQAVIQAMLLAVQAQERLLLLPLLLLGSLRGARLSSSCSSSS